jgi:hypothetical protein
MSRKSRRLSVLNCSQGIVCEPRQTLSQPEKYLYKIWLNKDFQLEHLKTNSGKNISIIKTGFRNESEGPDFLNAMIMLDNELMNGDIEIHIQNNDWYLHGHDTDENYDNVVLHVIQEETEEKFITKNNGRKTEVLCLPVKKELLRAAKFPCREWPPVKFKDFQPVIEKYAGKRFQRKTLIARKELLQYQPEQYFFIGLLDVMGYSKNRTPMKNIAKQLELEKLYEIIRQVDKDERLLLTEVILLGISGMLSNDYKKYFGNDHYFEALRQHWAKVLNRYHFQEQKENKFHFAAIRPQNHPHKRLVALAQIINNIYPRKPGQFCLNTLFSGRNTESILAILKEKFQQPAGMWKNHPLFSSHRSRVLIGDARLMDFITNIMLPFARALSSILKNEQNADYCIEINKQIPVGAMPGKIKELLNNLNIPAKEIKSNYLLQGCIEYNRLFCDLELCNMCLLESTIEFK